MVWLIQCFVSVTGVLALKYAASTFSERQDRLMKMLSVQANFLSTLSFASDVTIGTAMTLDRNCVL